MTKKESHKSFLVSFTSTLFCLLVFGMAAVLLVRPMEAPLAPEPIHNSVYLPQVQDSLTVLVAGVRDDIPVPAAPMTYMLIRLNPQKGNIPVATFPGNTSVIFQGKPCTLASLYESEGIIGVRDCMLETFGIAVDRYAKVPVSGFEKIVNLIGTTGLFIPREIRLTPGEITASSKSSEIIIGSSGGVLWLSEGMQQIDGKKAVALALSSDYSSSQERCKFLSTLASDAINQHLHLIRSDMAQQLFQGVVNLMETDLSFVDYANRKKSAEFMAELKQNPSVVIIPELSESAPGILSISSDSAAILRNQFGS